MNFVALLSLKRLSGNILLDSILLGYFQGFTSYKIDFIKRKIRRKSQNISTILSELLSNSWQFLSVVFGVSALCMVCCEFATNTISWLSFRLHRRLFNFIYVWNMWNKCKKKVVRLTENVHQFHLISKVCMFFPILFIFYADFGTFYDFLTAI